MQQDIRMSTKMIEEKRLLRSVAAGWGRRRNFSNFGVSEVSLFLKLQSSGHMTLKVDEKGWEWVTLTEAGEKRLQTLNKNLPS